MNFINKNVVKLVRKTGNEIKSGNGSEIEDMKEEFAVSAFSKRFFAGHTPNTPKKTNTRQ